SATPAVTAKSASLKRKYDVMNINSTECAIETKRGSSRMSQFPAKLPPAPPDLQFSMNALDDDWKSSRPSILPWFSHFNTPELESIGPQTVRIFSSHLQTLKLYFFPQLLNVLFACRS